MADFALTVASTLSRTLDGSESGFVSFLGGIYSSGSSAVVATTGTNWLSNHGFIYTANSGNPAIDANGSVFELTNGLTGVIDAENPSSGTVDINVSTLAQIINHGQISSTGNRAIDFDTADSGAFFELFNYGYITAMNSSAVQVNTGTAGVRIYNEGHIAAESFTLDFASDIAESGVHVVMNNGTITSTVGTPISAAFGDNAAFQITNNGTISGWSFGISSLNDTAVTLHNTGVIQSVGLGTAITLGGGAHTILNSGTIIGNVFLNDGADFFEGLGGSVNGVVSGGADNDTISGGELADGISGGDDNDLLVGRGGDDILSGDDGEDTILGGAGNDSVQGGGDNDTINGNAGDDTLDGNDGADVLVGQDGSDQLDGGIGDDILDGGNGDDILEGGDDNDILRGRNGEDELAGGLGRDYLTGGQGADSFVFRSVAETVVGANRDQILDFEQGVDLIVVAGLTPGVFEFKGTAAFAPSGNAELRLFETPTGSTIVQMDTDGNGTVDAEIRVGGVTGLTADDFVL